MAVDAIQKNFQFSIFNFQSIFNSQISNGMIESKKVILIKPQTFMNESGKAVKALADYYKISEEDITIIHDDLDIPLGEYRIVKDRSSAGHKGVQSVIDAIGTKDFQRVRIGIGTKPLDKLGISKKIPTEDFVLQNFTKEEKEIIDGVIERVAEKSKIG